MIVVLVIAVLVIGVIMYSSSQQSKRDRDLALQLQQMNNPTQPQSNLWSSIGDWGNLITSLGGMIGGGNNESGNEGARFSNPFENNDTNPFVTQNEAQELGQEFLVAHVEGVDFN